MSGLPMIACSDRRPILPVIHWITLSGRAVVAVMSSPVLHSPEFAHSLVSHTWRAVVGSAADFTVVGCEPSSRWPTCTAACVRHGPGDAGASDPDPCGGLDGVAADLEPPAPSWVPDGQPPRGFAWLTAIRGRPPAGPAYWPWVLGSFARLVTEPTLARAPSTGRVGKAAARRNGLSATRRRAWPPARPVRAASARRGGGQPSWAWCASPAW